MTVPLRKTGRKRRSFLSKNNHIISFIIHLKHFFNDSDFIVLFSLIVKYDFCAIHFPIVTWLQRYPIANLY